MSAKRAGAVVWSLLVVVAIGLLIPAIALVRAQADARDTKDNMKKLALALHACNDAHGCLPPAYDAFAGLQYPASVHVHLLPFIEQQALYESCLPTGRVKADAVIAGFHSSNDPTLGTGEGVQNFAANLRVFYDASTYNEVPVALAAIMPGKAGIPASFVCGTSNTYAFATKLASCRQSSSVAGIEIEGGSHFDADPTSPYAAYFGELVARKPAHPSDPEATFQLAPRGSECRLWPLLPQSFDSRGISVALADGSVRKVSWDVAPNIWNYAMQASSAGISGGEW
jgi:hypothetical protein